MPDPDPTEPTTCGLAEATGGGANHTHTSQCNPTVVSYAPLVDAIADRVFTEVPPNQILDRDGLVQAGLAGLMVAARLYSPDSCVAFAFYAQHRIRGEMLDTLAGAARRKMRMIDANTE